MGIRNPLTLLLLFVLPSTLSAYENLVYWWQDYDAKTPDPQIFLANADGSDAAVVAEGIYPEVSADGRSLFFIKANQANSQFALMRKNLDSDDVKQLTKFMSGFMISPDTSGNGRFLAFSAPVGPTVNDARGTRAKNQVVIADLWHPNAAMDQWIEPGAPGVEVIATEAQAYFPDLSSTGRFVVFHESHTPLAGKGARVKQIILYDRHSKTRTPITDEDGYCFEPAFSFDDRNIAFVCRDGELKSDDESTPRYRDNIYTVSFNGPRLKKNKTAVTTRECRNYAPTFRADGSIVFSSDCGRRDEEFQLYEAIRGDDGFAIRPLVQGDGIFYVATTTGDLRIEQVLQPNFNLPRSSFGAAQNHAGNIFLIAGHHGPEHERSAEGVTDLCEQQTQDGWQEIARRPHAGQGYEAFIFNDFLYAIGGSAVNDATRTGLASMATVDVYDLRSGSWQADAIAMKRPRSSFAAAQVGDKVYLLGGWMLTGDEKNMDHIARVEILDMETKTIEDSPFQMPQPLPREFDAFTVGDKIVIAGGMGDDFALLRHAWLFDPSAKNNESAWKELPLLPYGNFAPSLGAIGRHLFIFGGVQKTPIGDGRRLPTLYTSHIYHLDLDNLEAGWHHTGRYLREPKGFTRTLLGLDGSIDILGGQSPVMGTHISEKDLSPLALPVATHESFWFDS